MQEHQYRAPEGKEPNTEKLSVRIPKSMDEALSQLPDKNDFVRAAIRDKLDAEANAAALKKQNRPSRKTGTTATTEVS